MKLETWNLKPFCTPQLGPRFASHFSAHPINMTYQVAPLRRNTTPCSLEASAITASMHTPFIFNTFPKTKKS
jgi:hypothetical protein